MFLRVFPRFLWAFCRGWRRNWGHYYRVDPRRVGSFQRRQSPSSQEGPYQETNNQEKERGRETRGHASRLARVCAGLREESVRILSS